MQAILRRNGWAHFAFSPFLFRPCQCATGQSVLYKTDGGKMLARRVQLRNWSAWKDGMKLEP